MFLSKPIVQKLPCTLDVLSTVPHTLAKRGFSSTQPQHFLFSKKSSKENANIPPKTTPRPVWKMGEPQKVLKGKTLSFEPSKISMMETMKIMQTSFPRSCTVVSTISPEGVPNAAPFSFVSIACINPPTLAISVLKKQDGSIKDTQHNIDASNELGVNMISEWFVESAHAAQAELPPEESEFEKFGLTEKKPNVIKAPLIAQSAVSFECKVLNRIPFVNKKGKETTVFYLAEVVNMQINEEVYNKEKGVINHEAYKPILKLFGPTYGTIGQVNPVKME